MIKSFYLTKMKESRLIVVLYRDAKSTSFTSLSEKVAAIARDIHNGLWCALELETMNTITVQLLKVQARAEVSLLKLYILWIYSMLTLKISVLAFSFKIALTIGSLKDMSPRSTIN